MSTTQFTDDAFNKYVTKTSAKTLIGNWQEEGSIRDATGEGRTLPQRHIKRSGLLQDFTKLPSTTRKCDDTFQRVLGARKPPTKDPLPGTQAIEIPKYGARWKLDRAKCLEFSQEEMEQIDEARKLADQEREFETSNVARDICCPAPYNPAERQKNSYANEIMFGKAGSKEDAYKNSGLDAITNLDYTNQVPVTFYTQTYASTDPNVKSGVRVSCPTGANTYARDCKFTCPTSQYKGGRWKEEEMEETLYAAKKSGKHPNGATGMEPPIFGLSQLKGELLYKLREQSGLLALVKMRAELTSKAENGCVKKADLNALFLEIYPEIPDVYLRLYLDGLATMKKDQVQVSALFNSLVGACTPNAIKEKLLEGFRSGWRPEGIEEIPSTQDEYISFFCDIYAIDPKAVAQMLQTF